MSAHANERRQRASVRAQTAPAQRSPGRVARLSLRRLRQLLSTRSQLGELRGRYVDLLERAVTHSLYHPPDTRDAPGWVRESFERALEGMEYPLLTPEQTRAQGRDWPMYAPTMIGRQRLRNVRACTESAIRDSVPGDLIEAGCWRGGVAILMRGILAAYGERDRLVWAADSFQGVPPPSEDEYPADAGDLNYTAPELAVSREQVEANFRRFGLLDEQVRLLEGWFKDTLPTVRDRRWAVVRLDGDLYESTMDGLENLYPGLSVGGYLMVDDFAFDNCRQAVEDYRREHGITEPIEQVDWTGAYWRRRE